MNNKDTQSSKTGSIPGNVMGWWALLWTALLVLCLLLTSCSASPGEKTTEAVGFFGGNIDQGGLMGGDNNGNVYYRSEADHWYLYKAKLDGSAKQKLIDDVPCDINVLNGWVYYANYRDGFSIYRIRTDGTGHTRLRTGYCSNLYVVGRSIYYDIRDEANMSHIHRMDVDGSNDELLVSEARLAYYYGDSLYYINDKLYLCKYDLATGARTQLNDKYSHYVTVNRDGVYCWNPDENTFVRTNYEGGDAKAILSGGDYFNVSDKYVYYMKYGGNYDFYRLSLDTGENVQLSSFMAASFDAGGRIIENPDPATSEESNLFHEGGSFTYVIEGRVFIRATLRQSLLQTGRLDCLVRLDGSANMELWD